MPPKPKSNQPRTIFIQASPRTTGEPVDLDINISVGALTNKLHANVLAAQHFVANEARPKTSQGMRFAYKASALSKSPPPPVPVIVSEEAKDKKLVAQEDEVAKKRCFCF